MVNHHYTTISANMFTRPRHPRSKSKDPYRFNCLKGPIPRHRCLLCVAHWIGGVGATRRPIDLGYVNQPYSWCFYCEGEGEHSRDGRFTHMFSLNFLVCLIGKSTIHSLTVWDMFLLQPQTTHVYTNNLDVGCSLRWLDIGFSKKMLKYIFFTNHRGQTPLTSQV